MKRLSLLAILVVCLALVLPGCSSSKSTTSSSDSSSGDSASGDSGEGGDSTPEASSDRLTAADVQALIDGDLAGEAWVASVVGVSETTLLRRPVVSLEFSDSNARNDGNNALLAALSGSGKWGVLEAYDADMSGFIPVGAPDVFEPIQLPAAPTSAEEFAPWLQEAFGSGSPAPEDWVAHVKSAEYAASLPTGFTDVLVVRTDLPWGAEGLRTAQVIVQAIETAAPSFATSYTIYFAEENFETSGEIVAQMAAFGY